MEKFFINKSSVSSKPSIWIHAVSVGETIAVIPLINEILNSYSDHLIILTTMTDTGQNIAISRLSSHERLRIMYMPFDLRIIIRRFIKTLNVKLMITVETELWPNTFIASSETGIPVIIINGRISERSFNGYRKVKFFMKYIFERVTLFLVASELDRERLLRLGVSPEKVLVTGNIKFDLPHIPAPEIRINTKRKIIIIASTHNPEERLIIDSIIKILKNKEVFMILAPRHPQRFPEIERLLTEMGLKYIRRTDIHESIEPDKLEIDLMLLNTMGELSSFYKLADIVIMGGSFIPVGGHNILEAAYWSKPVICGQYMHNFPLSEEFFREGGAIMADKGNLSEVIRGLLDNPSLTKKIGQKANEIFMRNSGALMKTINLIKERFQD